MKVEHRDADLIWGTEGGVFQDALYEENVLYLLNNKKGMIRVRNFYRSGKTAGADDLDFFAFEYGEAQKLFKFGNIFEIICSYGRRNFVAEMMLTDGKLYLNRFYDRTRGVRHVDYFAHQLFLIGEEEIRIEGPAINRHYLLKTIEYPYSVRSFRLEQLWVVKWASNATNVVFVGVSADGVVYASLQR